MLEARSILTIQFKVDKGTIRRQPSISEAASFINGTSTSKLRSDCNYVFLTAGIVS